MLPSSDKLHTFSTGAAAPSENIYEMLLLQVHLQLLLVPPIDRIRGSSFEIALPSTFNYILLSIFSAAAISKKDNRSDQYLI